MKKKLISVGLCVSLCLAMGFTSLAGEELTVEENSVLIVSEDASYDSLKIGDGACIKAEEGMSLIMIADGTVTRPQAGEYSNVDLLVTPADYTFGSYDETGNEENYSFRYLYNKGGDSDIFVEEALEGFTQDQEGDYTILDGNDSELVVNEDRMNVLAVESENVILRNINTVVNGVGVCEFMDNFGAAISVTGDSNVIIDNVNATTHGAINCALNSAGGNVLVTNSEFHAYGSADDATGMHSGIDNYSNVHGSMTEVPWVLGMRGTVRATNIIGDANLLYYNDYVTSNGWGCYSTDGGQVIVNINCDAAYDASEGPAFNSLYGVYVSIGSCNLYGLNVDLTGADENTYGIIARHAFDLHSSSPEALAALKEEIKAEPEEEETAAEEAPAEPETAAMDNGDSSGESGESAGESGSGSGGGFQSVGVSAASDVWDMFEENVDVSAIEGRRSSLNAKFGVMSHGCSDELFNITDTDITASEAAFLMKNAYMDIQMDGSVSIDAPIIIHEQVSDDASAGDFAYDGCWAISTAPFLYELEATGIVPEQGVDAVMTGMTLNGDFYNTDVKGAYLNLSFENTEVNGVISSGTFLHDNASYYVVNNPAFDDSAEEGAENLRYICVDESGNAYKTAFATASSGDKDYYPEYTDENGDITFIYDEGTAYSAEDIVGYAIFFNAAQYCNTGSITACEAIDDPVYAEFTDGSVWNVTGTSYLARLSVEEGSQINGIVTVNGEEVDVTSGGNFEGSIVVTPAA